MTSPHPRSPAAIPAPDPFSALAYLAARDAGAHVGPHLANDADDHVATRRRGPLDRLRRAGQVALTAVSALTGRWADALDHGRPTAA